jgi:hypothetical protein
MVKGLIQIKKNFPYLLHGVEIFFCIIFILGFVYFEMNSVLFQRILIQIHPFGLYFLFFTIILCLIISCFPSIETFFLKENLKHCNPFGKRQTILILLTLAICIFTIPLITTWSLGEFHQNNVGGLLPIFDAGAFYNGAEHVLDTGKVDAWNERRPINSIFLATRLLLTNFDFRSTLILQAILCGISAFFVAFLISNSIGKWSGLLTFAVLFAFSAFFLADNLSENMGFIFGCLSFSLIWYSVFKHNRTSFLVGVFFFTIGFVIRPGPFLLLPAFIIFAGFFCGKTQKFNWKNASLSTLMMGTGIFLNQCVIWIFGEQNGIMMGNFATSLYGLAAGGKGWQQYMVDFPYESTHMSEKELYSFLYSKSFELIIANPVQFFKTILSYYLTLPIDFFNQLYHVFIVYSTNLFLSEFGFIIFSITLILIGIGIFRFYRISNDRSIKILFSLVLITTFLSLPFYLPDGGIRTVIILAPYLALGFVLGIIGWRPPAAISKKLKYPNSQSLFAFILPMIFGFTILFSVFLTPTIGPILKHDILNGMPENSIPLCTQDEIIFHMRVDSGIPYLEMNNNNSTLYSFAPIVNPDDFSNSVERYYLGHYYDLISFINGDDYPVLFYGYDLNYHQSILVLAPKGMIHNQHRIINFCGIPNNSTKLGVFSVYELNKSSLH